MRVINSMESCLFTYIIYYDFYVHKKMHKYALWMKYLSPHTNTIVQNGEKIGDNGKIFSRKSIVFITSVS